MPDNQERATSVAVNGAEFPVLPEGPNGLLNSTLRAILGTPEAVNEWLDTPNGQLYDCKPRELIEAGRTALVEGVIVRAAMGIPT